MPSIAGVIRCVANLAGGLANALCAHCGRRAGQRMGAGRSGAASPVSTGCEPPPRRLANPCRKRAIRRSRNGSAARDSRSASEFSVSSSSAGSPIRSMMLVDAADGSQWLLLHRFAKRGIETEHGRRFGQEAAHTGGGAHRMSASLTLAVRAMMVGAPVPHPRLRPVRQKRCRMRRLFDATDTGQIEIHQHHVKVIAFTRRNRVFTVAYGGHLVTQLFEHDAEQLAVDIVVFHHHHRHRAQTPRPARPVQPELAAPVSGVSAA